MVDSLGIIGNAVTSNTGEWAPIIIQFLLIPLGAGLFRAAQKMLQKLPTKWKWVNNKLTVSIISKIIGGLFGKTTLIYNAQIENREKEKKELRKQALQHLARNGGILKEFDEAIKNS